MKRFKIALAALLVTGGIVAAFAFNSKSVQKPTPTTYYYVTGTCDQRIDANITNTDCKLVSLVNTVFKNTASWTTTSNSPTFGQTAPYIAAISFELDDVPGDNDGALTLQEAINAVWDDYQNNFQTLPDDQSTITVGTAVITVRRKTSAL